MNSSLIGDISEFLSRFTKFPVVILSRSVDKIFLSISRDHVSRDSVGEIPSA